MTHLGPHHCRECHLCLCDCPGCITADGQCDCPDCPCSDLGEHVCACPSSMALVFGGEV